MRSININFRLGTAVLMAGLLAACGQLKNDSQNDDGNGAAEGLPLMADCDDGNPNVGACMVGLDCQFDHCLPPGAGCAVSLDCPNEQDMCDVQTWSCVPSGCEDNNGAVGWCDQLTNSQADEDCVPLNEEPAGMDACCDEDADCDLAGGNGNGLCNQATHMCVECLGDADCPADMRCNLDTLLCRPEPCEQQRDWCLQPVRNEITHACSQVPIENCCNAGDDVACRMFCSMNADCPEGMECQARPGGESYCVPTGSQQIRGCQVNAQEGQPNQCAWGDDEDHDGTPEGQEVCGDNRDNNANALIDENCPQNCAPAADVCNGIDDDCDGMIDNVFNTNDPITMGCGTDEGECVMGVSTCMNAQWGACNGEVTPVAEACDGMDNDCDGMTDEDAMNANPLTMACYSGPEGTEGVGLCQGGWSSCMMAQWGPCMGEVVPADDTCDGADNNCNGATDEGFGLGQVCSIGMGDCTSVGVVVCDGPNAAMCNAQVIQPGVEVCDAGHLHDEDCDGQTDPAALCDADGDTILLPEDLCPELATMDQTNVDSNPARGDACFKKVEVMFDEANPAGRSHLFYQGSDPGGDLDGGVPGYALYFLTEQEACTWGAEVAGEVGNSGVYYICNQGAPGANAIHIEVDDVLTPNVPVGHPWVCGGQVASNLALSMQVLGCPGQQPN